MGDCFYLHLLALGLVQLLLCGSLGMQKSASSLLPQVTSVALHAGGHGTGEQKLTPAWQHKPTRHRGGPRGLLCDVRSKAEWNMRKEPHASESCIKKFAWNKLRMTIQKS